MGDCKPNISELAAEEELIALAQQIVKALGKNRNLTDDAWKTLANLGLQLSNIAIAHESIDEDSFEVDESLNEIENQLNEVRDKIMDWEKDDSMIWDHGPEEAYEYLKVVDRAQKLTKSLENMSLNGSCNANANALLRTAHDVLQTSMARLEEEFRHLLVRNRQPFEPEHVSFRSCEEDIVEASSIVSFGDESVDDGVQRDSMSQRSDDHVFELLHPDVIPDLKAIAHLMFESNYGQECSQMFINVQRDALDDSLFILEVEKLSIEDVLKMDWNTLNSKIRRWMWAVKIFVRVYLAGEKLLSDQIFGELDLASSVCFVESSKPAILQLLNFGEAISIGPHQPEKLIRILDMYEVLSELIPDIDTLYSDETGNDVRTECHETLRGLGESAKATFLEFENAVASNVSANAFPGGGVHHLTRYVMNYIKTLTDYRKTLNILLKDEDKEDPTSVSPDRTSVSEDDSVSRSSCTSSPMALHFRALISILECNLDEKSKMYRDEALQHLFLMNNIHYMAEKVKNSELRAELGDGWIRRQNRKFQQHAMSYERATWSSILALLKDEGIQNPSSNSTSRTILKERLQSFYLAFEEVYKSQTGWLIPDGQLREDLRISTSLKVIQAYRTFVGRHVNHVSEKHIKYTADDLQDYLFHLFEGAQKSLHGYHYHKK